MYLVYLLPLLLIVLVALAIFTGPIVAVILFVLFLIGLGAYKFLGPGTDPEHAPASEAPANGPAAASTATDSSEEETGVWGETWPEQREGT